ncbi:hypothetical protein L227DRAFT_658736 [Lentinus tigrinus ALCF2SS1-6]|uniref:Uncharacterized protein n=1 Tax=Lentinus tigrinus ALCF2SS1-6 TaxID=1328759 RepID=A0A5C2RMN4_9APHY|nr:hypothetical protein L227DRAFT_658736 [Lentinus tigrinus ALCF2SS1-6]
MPSVLTSTIWLPPELHAISDFHAIVDLLIVEPVFPTLLIPIAFCLCLFTKPEIRRKPVFVLNVLSVMLFGGIAIATVSRVVSGRLVSPELITALTGLYFFIPVCVQCMLFVRIFAVH